MLMRVLAGHRRHGAHRAAHETLDVVGEIRKAVLTARRAEIGDVDIEAGGRDVAGERPAGQEIEDEVAADGRRHEQHGWDRTAADRIRRATAASAACSRGRRRWRASPRCRSGPVSSKSHAGARACFGRGGTVRAGLRARAPGRALARAPLRSLRVLGFPLRCFLPGFFSARSSSSVKRRSCTCPSSWRNANRI